MRLVALVASAALASAVSAGSAFAAAPAGQAAVYTGYGFDTCSAPSPAALSAWLASPYRAVGIYVGGVNRACPDGNLSASWVATVTAGGWYVVPLYVGLQAPCVSQAGLALIDPGSAAAQGAAAADDAAARAAVFGLGAGTPLYFDMEGYATNDAACTQVVQAFLGAWVAEVHARGYVAGVYGSAASTMRDLVPLVGTPGTPDNVWIANWNGQASVFGDPYLSDGYWVNHQRLHQYQGGHDESYAGVTLNIDSNYLDGAVVGAVPGAPPAATPPPPAPRQPQSATSGEAATPDGQTTVSWPASAFAAAASVTLAPSTLQAPTNGFAAGGYLVQLAAASSAGGPPIGRFGAPLALSFHAPPAGTIPAFSPDGSSWKALPLLASGTLPPRLSAGYVVGSDGSIQVTTIVPGWFGLLGDVRPPTPPARIAARFAQGALVLDWSGSRDNSGVVQSYQISFGGTPLVALAGTAREASLRTFHPRGPSVFRLVAVDASGNRSTPSRPLVVVPAPRPASLPRPFPAWAWRLLAWQQHGRVAAARPVTPAPLPDWYWQWASWRLHPFRLAR